MDVTCWFVFFLFTSSVLVVSPVVPASCAQILTKVVMTQYGENKRVCGVWWDVGPNLPLILGGISDVVFSGCISKPLAFESPWLLFDGSC